MSIIKKLFPDYESKAEMKARLESEIRTLNMFSHPNFSTIDRDVIKVGAMAEIDERYPIDMAKGVIRRKIAEELEPFIEYNVFDSENRRSKELIGTIYISIRRK